MSEDRKSAVKEKLEILRHSASHILAQAVKRLFPEAKLGFIMILK